MDNDEPEEEDMASGMLINKSKLEATFTSLDKPQSMILVSNNNKDDDKNEQELANLSYEKEMKRLISYINEQITFYSDLCLGRNYIWKRTLESIFPMQFVFAQIYNKKIFKGNSFDFSIKIHWISLKIK